MSTKRPAVERTGVPAALIVDVQPGPDPQPEPAAVDVGVGHNGGPPIDEPVDAFVRYAWAAAHRAVWKNPPMDILRFRVARAEAVGVSYREYMLALLDTGQHLQAEPEPRAVPPPRAKPRPLD